MIWVAILVPLLALIVVAAIAWPLLAPQTPTANVAPSDPEATALEDEIAATIQAIKDLEFDRDAGNIDDSDFERLNLAERGRLARLLRRRDARNPAA